MRSTPPPIAVPAGALGPAARRLGRWALVLGGYAGAAMLAGLALSFRQAHIDPVAAAAAGGMYAAGDAMLWLGVFGVVSLAPTGLALYFLRDAPWFWEGFAAISLAVAATAPLAVLGYAVDRTWIAALSVLRLLGSPLLAVALGLGALACPRPPAPGRRILLVAAVAEGAVALVVVVGFSIALVFSR